MGANLETAIAIYVCLGIAQSLAIYSRMPRGDRMPVIALLVLGAIVGTPVFIVGIMRASAREIV